MLNGNVPCQVRALCSVHLHSFCLCRLRRTEWSGYATRAEVVRASLPGAQEEGNIPYVVDNGVGTFETHPERIAHIMHRWLLGSAQQRSEFQAMGQK